MASGDDGGGLPNYLAQTEPAIEGGSKRRLGAALASAILPGLGQLLLGAKRRALIYFLFLLAIALLYWPFRLPTTYGGLIVLCWLTLLPPVLSTRDSLRAKNHSLPPKSRWWLALFVPLALFVSVLYANCLFRLAGFRNYSVPSSSMETTIGKGNLLVADLFAYRHATPSPNEVVLFRRDKMPFVKRVIAGPASIIEGKAGGVLVDGKRLSEPYVQHTGTPIPALVDFGPVSVPAGKLFVMGDNRDVSYDSRVREFGFVDIKDVLGKPLYIYRSNKGWRGRDIH